MVVFNIWNRPQVSRVLSSGVARKLTFLGPFIILLARIFLRNSDRIEVESVFVLLCEPNNGLISPREASTTMQTVAEMPYDTVPQFQSVILKNGI